MSTVERGGGGRRSGRRRGEVLVTGGMEREEREVVRLDEEVVGREVSVAMVRDRWGWRHCWDSCKWLWVRVRGWRSTIKGSLVGMGLEAAILMLRMEHRKL